MSVPQRIPERGPGEVDQRPRRPESIEQVRLKTVRGFRHRLARALRGVLGLTALGGAAGWVAGHHVEGRYHEWMGYSHEPPAHVTKAEEPAEAMNEGEPSFLQSARVALKRAKDAALEKATDLVEHTDTFQAYQEFKQKMLDTGDTIAFWGSFLLTFLAAVILLRKAMRLAHALQGGVDPLLKDDMRTIEQALNRLIDRVNGGVLESPHGGDLLRTEVGGLTRRFDAAMATLHERGLVPASVLPKKAA